MDTLVLNIAKESLLLSRMETKTSKACSISSATAGTTTSSTTLEWYCMRRKADIKMVDKLPMIGLKFETSTCAQQEERDHQSS